MSDHLEESADQRQHARYPTNHFATVSCYRIPPNPEKEPPANVAIGVGDISLSGVRLLVSKLLPVGELVSLFFHTTVGGSLISAWGRIIWAEYIHGAPWVGIELEQPLAETVLDLFVKREGENRDSQGGSAQGSVGASRSREGL